MTDTLIVQLVPPISVTDDDGHSIFDCVARWVLLPGEETTDALSVETGDLSRLLQQPPADCQWIILMPGEDVLTRVVSLPRKRRRQALKALPFMLEDSVASDMALEHLAVGPENTQGDTLVAITRKQQLRDFLQEFTAAGIIPHAVLPDYALLRENPDTWQILLDGDRALVRCPDGTGFSTPLSRLALLLNTGQDPEGDSSANSVLVIRSADTSTVALPDDWQISEQLVADPFLHLAADASNPPLNLLQEEFKVARQDSWNWRPWAMAAVLAVVVISIGLLQVGLETVRFNRENDRLQASMIELAREALPDTKQIRDPQTQMLIAWRQISNGGAGDAEFLPLLNQVSATVSQQSVIVQSIHYRDGALTLALQGTSLQQLDKLRQQIEQQGFDASMLEAGTEADSAHSNLVIRALRPQEQRSAG